MNTDIQYDMRTGLFTSNGDVVVIDELNCLVQEIKIESVTAEGDLWYDAAYGWSLQDFIHRNIDEMLRLEISHRVKLKMAKRTEVVQESIQVTLEDKFDAICIHIRFAAYGQDVAFTVILDNGRVEVTILG